MIYQETYQAGGNPNKLNISGVIYTQDVTPSPAKFVPLSGFPSHCHSFYEIDYTMEGTCEFEFDGRRVTAGPNSLIFHPPLCVHSVFEDRRSARLLLQFSHRLLMSFSSLQKDSILLPQGPLHHNGFVILEEGSQSLACMQKLLEAVPRKSLSVYSLPTINNAENQITGYTFSDEIRLHAHVLSLLSSLLSEGTIHQKDSGYHLTNLSGMEMLLNRLISHPEEKLSMEDAAAFANMSYSNFCRSFKAAIGYSYVDFCNVLRVRRAQELLQDPRKSVTEISSLLNFGSVSYFNRIFKKLTGSTPLAYRASR